MNSRVQDHPKVRELAKKLEVAEAELSEAQRLAHDASRAMEEQDDDVLKLEALAEIGEASPEDASKKAKELQEARDKSSGAKREAQRKQYVVNMLRDRLAQAEEAALEELREQYDKRYREAVEKLGEALKPAIEANKELAAAHDAYLGSRLKMPHESLVWRDLLESPSRDVWGRHWHGDGGAKKGKSRNDFWREQARKLGYDV